MFVGKRMKTDVITVSPSDSLYRASALLKEHRIHHLPVMDQGKLVGILTDTDIRNARLEESGAEGAAKETRAVGEIMTRNVITLSPRDTIEDAALILHRKRFEALPVMEGQRVVGIIAKADVIAAFLDTLKIEGVGVRIEVVLPRELSSVQRLFRQLAEMELEVRSLILSPLGKEFVAFVRVVTIDVATVRDRLRGAGFKVPDVADFLK